jgi:hypothetical protein
VFLGVVAVVVFGKPKYDAQIAAADNSAPADLLHLAQLRDPGLEDYRNAAANGDDLMAIVDALYGDEHAQAERAVVADIADELHRRRGRHRHPDNEPLET